MSGKSRLRQLIVIAFSFGSVLHLGGWVEATAQETKQQADSDEQTRQIKMSGFTKNRPAAPPVGGSKPSTASGDTASWNVPTYHRVKPKPIPKSSSTSKPSNVAKPVVPKPINAQPPITPTEVKEVGVTLWRLRPAKETDSGPAFTVLQSGKPLILTPERIEGTSPVALGERVRLSIESPRTGYLYVINREQYADGTTGAPTLIFPSSHVRGGDNGVTAGRLIDIPDTSDARPFFTLTSNQKPDQPQILGELLTVLITPRPLEGVAPGRDPLKLPAQQVAKWEADWSGEVVELLEMNNGAGKTWTHAEKLASETTRALTQVDPTPQTIYRVTGKSNDPVMVTVQLLYGVTAAPKTAVPGQP